MLVRHGVRDMVMDQNQLVFLGGYLSAEYRKKLASATTCANCGNKHPNVADVKCWELEANAADHPANWKPTAERLSRAQS